MSQLPAGWSITNIEDVLLPLSDGRLLSQGWSPRCLPGPAHNEDEWAVLKTTAIQDGFFIPEENKKLPPNMTARPGLEVHPGDLLLTCAGPRRRCGIACLVRATRKNLMISGKMYRFRVPEKHISPEYIEYFLRSADTQQVIDEMKTGISDSGLNLTHERFFRLPIAIPPFPEQLRVVKKIGSLSSKSKRARQQLDHIPLLVERYRQAILAAAFRGDLTRDLRPKSNKVWDEISVGDLFEWSSGKNLPSKRQAGGSVPVIGGNGVSGYHDTALIDFPTLAIGRVGAQCGNVHHSEGPAWITDNAIYATSISGRIALEFAILFFRISNLNSLAGGTGQPYVNQTVLNELAIPVPSAEEQGQLVRRVDTAFAWIDRLATEATSARGLIDHLDRAVLAKAFQGKLVPQDPRDEPASVLLQRIRVEKSASATPTEPARSRRRRQ